jgi:hypothetical protein
MDFSTERIAPRKSYLGESSGHYQLQQPRTSNSVTENMKDELKYKEI